MRAIMPAWVGEMTSLETVVRGLARRQKGELEYQNALLLHSACAWVLLNLCALEGD
jgi:hypothetical protein